MAGRTNQSPSGGYRILTVIWLLVSAVLAYPAFSLLSSMGLNQALAGTLVFIGICLLYDIPYRARVSAQHQAALSKAEQWRGRGG